MFPNAHQCIHVQVHVEERVCDLGTIAQMLRHQEGLLNSSPAQIFLCRSELEEEDGASRKPEEPGDVSHPRRNGQKA